MTSFRLSFGISLLAWSVLASACGDTDAEQTSGKTSVLLIILDDLGAASLGAYADYWGKKSWNGKTYKPARTPPTPNINNICTKGVRFLDTWSNPTCSPTRANILTGRHGFRTGVGEPCGAGTASIGTSEPSLPSIIAKHFPEYGLGSVGKWHLGKNTVLGGDKAPNTMGWQYYAGILAGVADYHSWDRTVNGVTATSTNYSTTQITDDAIAYYKSLASGQPYLLWVAYNAPHTPMHLPPSSLHSYSSLSSTYNASKAIDYFEAMVESVDTEIGRLLKAFPDEDKDGMPDNTLVLVLGDNGTLNGAGTKLLPEPFNTASGKGTLYEHGVRVPLCIAGKGVASGGRDEDALVNVVDLYDTMLEAVGVDLAALPTSTFTFDSVSLTPYLQNKTNAEERSWIMTEQFRKKSTGKGVAQGIAVKSTKYKFIRSVTSSSSVDKYTDMCFAAENLVDDASFELYAASDKTASAACDSLKDTALALICKETGSPWASWCP